MKQIYNFEQQDPPQLTEKKLLKELERRSLGRRTVLLAFAGFLSQIAVLIPGLYAARQMPVISVFCFGYIMVTVTGSAVLAVLCSEKGGKKLWLELQ